MTRWQIIRVLLIVAYRVFVRRDYLGLLRDLLPKENPPAEPMKHHPSAMGFVPELRKMVRGGGAHLLVVLLLAGGAMAAGQITVTGYPPVPVTIKGGTGINIAGGVITASAAADFANYTTIDRVAKSELSSATNSTSVVTAANSAAVKAAYDLAAGKQAVLTGVSSVEMNASGAGDRNTYIDLHSDDTNTDFSTRVIREPGANGNLIIKQAGGGLVAIDGPTPKLFTGYGQVHISKSIAVGDEYNGEHGGIVSQITLDSGYGVEPTNWTQYNPFHARMYLNGEGSLQGFATYGKITGAAPGNTGTNAKDMSGFAAVLESNVTDTMTTNEIRIVRGDDSTGGGAGYPVSRGLNIQMVKYDVNETTNFGWDASNSCNSCALWAWGGGGAFATQRSYAGLAASGSFKYGLDLSKLTGEDAAIYMAAGDIISDGTNTASVAQLRDATKIQGKPVPTAGVTEDLKFLQYNNTSGAFQYATGGTGGAPTAASYITLGNDSTLSAERVLTGTTNQITITDNGVNNSVVLALPQNIHTGASPTFSGITANGQATIQGINTTSPYMIVGNQTVTHGDGGNNHGLYFAPSFKNSIGDWSTSYGILAIPKIGQSTTATWRPNLFDGIFVRLDGDAGATGVVPDARAIDIANPSKGGLTMTNVAGIYVANQTAGSATNRGVQLDVAAGSGKHNFYVSGTADNYVAGNVGIGTPSPAEKLDVTGNIKASAYIISGHEEQTASFTVSKDSSKITLASGTAVVTLPAVLKAGHIAVTVTVAGAAASGVSFAAATNATISWGDAGAPTFTNGKRTKVICDSQNAADTTTAAWDCVKGGNY